jgi:D-beta-D-heptose 7-phosphate kinase/D-beta-D-heptose 1-phosphate adenosyltransferase
VVDRDPNRIPGTGEAAGPHDLYPVPAPGGVALLTTRDKVVSLEELTAWRARQTGPVVFTNGVFDLLHPGHVEYLEAASGLGDALVVGVNDDASARRLEKGSGRPINSAPSRARMVASMQAVNRVVIFPEDTPLAVIEVVRPDVLVKGGDYSRATIVGADFVESYGGTVLAIDLIPGFSTTALVERIRASS